jgi:seryl-tRNA synthetase
MHDIKFIRSNPDAFDAGLKRRGLAAQSAAILALDEARRKEKTELQEMQSKRNALAKQVGQAKAKGENADAILAEAKKVGEDMAALDARLGGHGELETLLEILPNIPADDVPEGSDEKDNKEVRVVGTKPNVPNAKLHDDLGVALGLMDFDGAAKLSGSRFVVLKGALARMERALASFMLDIHTQEFGYTEHVPPFLVRDNAMYGTGQLPKFAKDLYKLADQDEDANWETVSNPDARKELVQFLRSIPLNDLEEKPESLDFIVKQLREHYDAVRKIIDYDYYLIPTAEVPLTNLVSDSILDEDELAESPIRMTAYTPCFRSEAGAAGKDTRGMIRQHQFTKVEMVSVVHPYQSVKEHERMTGCAEEILKRLGLHYRVMLLCAGDMGFSAQKTYDLEVWMPGQDAFREISSCSNCGDFQARRMKARFKSKGAKETQFVHTLNGSGLAIGRTMVAILENYQQPDGSIAVPEALQPYMGGLKVIEAVK